MPELSPVPIKKISAQIHGVGGYRTVHTVAGLAGILMSDNWPKKAGDPFFQRAMAACLTALEVQGQGDKARKAFVNAARNAGITILPDDAAKH
ncbi:DUF982 domain-containing protein [Rhizobium mesosinicum]|uniref:DUF982 domain-containing protein n=1 Tax=Rhizobium mesosinicum TaxID=335017 RepID=A0ABS7H0F9_9HYPH|nr:DUF982 domain-containing protein [Rhizobium mesosinicum]MBW9055641.1 DUF982 domain-containing protein [Rhizobium mesosinicum]